MLRKKNILLSHQSNNPELRISRWRLVSIFSVRRKFRKERSSSREESRRKKERRKRNNQDKLSWTSKLKSNARNKFKSKRQVQRRKYKNLQ